jgi:hypothetical protein
VLEHRVALRFLSLFHSLFHVHMFVADADALVLAEARPHDI